MSNTRLRTKASPVGKRLLLTARDIQIFKLLNRFRYLPSDFILAHVGGHPVYHKARLTDLFHEGWLDKPIPQWEHYAARSRFNVYGLGKKAQAYLEEEGQLEELRISSGGHYRHELMVSTIMSSLELSAQKDNIVLHHWKDVLGRHRPKEGGLAEGFSIPTLIKHQGREVNALLKPDGLPFGIEGRRSFWFLGIEADRHSEPLHPTDLWSRNSSILRKFLQYQCVVRDRLFETRFGLPNLLVLFLTANVQHMKNMMALWHEVHEGQGAKWLLFKTLPEYALTGPPIAPRYDLLATPWERPGNPPINLLEELRRAP